MQIILKMRSKANALQGNVLLLYSMTIYECHPTKSTHEVYELMCDCHKFL